MTVFFMLRWASCTSSHGYFPSFTTTRTFGQTPASWKHPRVPYEILIDAQSLPIHLVLEGGSSVLQVLNSHQQPKLTEGSLHLKSVHRQRLFFVQQARTPVPALCLLQWNKWWKQNGALKACLKARGNTRCKAGRKSSVNFWREKQKVGSQHTHDESSNRKKKSLF